MTFALPVEFRQPILLLSAFLAIPVYLWARSDGGRVLFSSFRLLPQGGRTWRMRLAFLPPWAAVLPPDQAQGFLAFLEGRLDRLALERGGLHLEVPYLCLDALRA